MAEEWVPINQIYYLNSNDELDYPQMCDASTGYVGDLTPKAEYLGLLNSSNLVRFHVDSMNGGGELQIYLSDDGQAGYGTTGEIIYVSDFLGLTREFLVSEIRYTDEYFTGLQVRTNYGDPESPVALYIDIFLDLGLLAPPEIWTSFIGSIESNTE